MLQLQAQRFQWIDAVKGIGIVLVLIGHCNIEGINPYIYLFHMQLFYVISGYCWNIDKNRGISFKEFANKKFHSYIIPYFKIATICFRVFGLGANLIRIGYGSEYLHQLIKYIFGIIIYSRGTTEWLPNCSPIWFLTALFFAELMFYWIMKQKRPYIYVVLAGALGYICYLIGKVFPWNIDNAFTAIPFLFIGILIRRYWHAISESKYLIPLIAASLGVFCVGYLGGDYDGNNLKNIQITGVEAVVVIITLLSICYKGRRLHFMSYLGRNSLMLFGYNYAINTFLHFVIPSINNTWFMSLFVIILGILLIPVGGIKSVHI